MAKKKTKKVLTLPDGERFEILKEDGKYYFCEGRFKWRKLAPGKVTAEKIAEEEEK